MWQVCGPGQPGPDMESTERAHGPKVLSSLVQLRWSHNPRYNPHWTQEPKEAMLGKLVPGRGHAWPGPPQPAAVRVWCIHAVLSTSQWQQLEAPVRASSVEDATFDTCEADRSCAIRMDVSHTSSNSFPTLSSHHLRHRKQY